MSGGGVFPSPIRRLFPILQQLQTKATCSHLSGSFLGDMLWFRWGTMIGLFPLWVSGKPPAHSIPRLVVLCGLCQEQGRDPLWGHPRADQDGNSEVRLGCRRETQSGQGLKGLPRAPHGWHSPGVDSTDKRPLQKVR